MKYDELGNNTLHCAIKELLIIWKIKNKFAANKLGLYLCINVVEFLWNHQMKWFTNHKEIFNMWWFLSDFITWIGPPSLCDLVWQCLVSFVVLGRLRTMPGSKMQRPKYSQNIRRSSKMYYSRYNAPFHGGDRCCLSQTGHMVMWEHLKPPSPPAKCSF